MINIIILNRNICSRDGTKRLIERQTMRRKIILSTAAIIYVFLAALGIYLGHRQNLPEPTTQPYVSSMSGPADTDETVVFVTQGGMWYHRGYCRELQKYRIPVKLSVVHQYCRPCTKCRPQR
jgi:hypothetical protein